MSRFDEPPTTGGVDRYDRRTHVERICDMDPFPAQVTRCPMHQQLFGGKHGTGETGMGDADPGEG